MPHLATPRARPLATTALRTWLAALLALGAGAVRAGGIEFVVTRTDDPVPDECRPGDCSLREAMLAAEANDPFADADVIVLGPGTHALVRGPLDAVRQPLRVVGAGSPQTRIELGDDAYLFEATENANLRLAGIEIASGDGVVVIHDGASARLDDVVVADGHVSVGSGSNMTLRASTIRRTLYNHGELLVEDSAIFNLYQMRPQSGVPHAMVRRCHVDGALHPDAALPSAMTIHAGTLEIEASLLDGTTVRAMGASTTRISDATVTEGEMSLVADGAELELRRIHYIGNTGPVRAEAAATITIEDSLFEDNPVRALYAAGSSEWNITGSSFVANQVDGNAGGAIVLEDTAALRIRNSTFHGNGFSVAAAADGARGGAIGFRNGAGARLVLQHVTLVRPWVMPVGVVGTVLGGHGTGVTLDVSNTIVSGSCGFGAGVLQNNAGNIESPGNTCGLASGDNLVGVGSGDLALGTLGDHGGPTPTILPAEGSVAIDGAGTPQCLEADQRGFPRPGGARCDVGSVEADADTLFADGFDG